MEFFSEKNLNKQSMGNGLGEIKYTQVDITESFDDNLRHKLNEWIKTIPLNLTTSDPELRGLPSKDASAKEVYKIASSLSKLREGFPFQDDGVYCPICNIANIDINNLHTPCPKCGRNLLRFGWT